MFHLVLVTIILWIFSLPFATVATATSSSRIVPDAGVFYTHNNAACNAKLVIVEGNQPYRLLVQYVNVVGKPCLDRGQIVYFSPTQDENMYVQYFETPNSSSPSRKLTLRVVSKTRLLWGAYELQTSDQTWKKSKSYMYRKVGSGGGASPTTGGVEPGRYSSSAPDACMFDLDRVEVARDHDRGLGHVAFDRDAVTLAFSSRSPGTRGNWRFHPETSG